MKKVNAYAFMNDDGADQEENFLWYAIEDGKLVISDSEGGPKVALSDQSLVWLAIEGLCRLRSDDEQACCEEEGESNECCCPKETPTTDRLCSCCHGEKPA